MSNSWNSNLADEFWIDEFFFVVGDFVSISQKLGEKNDLFSTEDYKLISLNGIPDVAKYMFEVTDESLNILLVAEASEGTDELVI